MSRNKPRREALQRPEKSEPKGRRSGGDVWIFGLHAVAAALANPERRPKRLLLTQEAFEALQAPLADSPHPIQPSPAERRDIEAVLGPSAVHQGAAMLCPPLPGAQIEDIPDSPADGGPKPKRAVVVALDQVTDPHNIGAVLRSAAAFGALAVVMPDRHAPEETGTIAKAACGALETVPLVRAPNFARALDALKAEGYWCVGLDGEADKTLAAQDLPDKLVLVLGAEGAGLRRLSREACDFAARLPIRPAMESLNVSNACAIALYELLA